MGKRPTVRKRASIYPGENPRLRRELVGIRGRFRKLTKDNEAAQREIAELRQVVTEQAEHLETLVARLEPVLSREDDLRAMLLGAHEQLMRRADEIQTTLAAELHKAAAQQSASEQNVPEQKTPEAHASVLAPDQSFVPAEYSDYQQLSKHIYYQRLVRRIREVVRGALPPGTTVVVVSKGDDELLKLEDGRRGWHFPQNEEGAYAGYYPADSARAISHLEELRDKGAEFLLFPETAFWWLERYGEFGQHLDGRYPRVWDDESCIIYGLSEPRPESVEGS